MNSDSAPPERLPTPTVEITLIAFDGVRTRCAVPVGQTVMDAALDHDVPGIVAQCGGACTCATCHCHIDSRWRSHLPSPSADEVELLTYVLRPDERSRLACQIPLNDAMQGMLVYLPEYQQ